jgi:diguanylate cyclase (GGDEF)-like protein
MKEHEQQLEHIAHFDALTNLPNRVLLADRLKQAILQTERRKYQLAVIYLDLDGFKTVNDTHGHDTGDDLLIIISQRMKEALREGDTLARIGGDEFVAVLVDLEQTADCELVLNRLLDAASSPAIINEVELHVSASIGVTFYPQDYVDADQLMRHADQAMYIAKQSGKNCYHLFDIEHDSSIKIQHELLERIRSAHQHNEFVLYFQPKVNMRTGEVIGAEALIRWQHPERGLLPPSEFLPFIENHEIAIQIGEWVIDSALTQISTWQAADLNISVSVNIGARQLQQHDFVTKLLNLLSKYPEINPANLELEILETSALENLNDVSHVIRTCREIGVQFALDDFGTGYSSLTYLRHLPVTMLKIDQTFVRDMLDDPDDLTIVKSVIGLAAAFQRQVIAEGVETLAHGAVLQSIGCELAQGYGIARPMPAIDIPAWVVDWTSNAGQWNSS